jgi:hypothetical protein
MPQERIGNEAHVTKCVYYVADYCSNVSEGVLNASGFRCVCVRKLFSHRGLKPSVNVCPMGLNRAFRASASLVLAWAFATGCTVNSASTTQCSVDAGVACTGNSVGYSCQGDATPQQTDSSITCGAGVTEADGDTGFCCGVQASSAACATDATVVCTDGSTGYSCGTGTPTDSDPTQACGAGVSDNNGNTDYCCVTTTTSSCAPDETVAGCSDGSYGFSCTSTDTPTDGNSSLTCSDSTAGPDGASLYCCVGFTPGTSSCMPDSSVVGCMGSSFGFSCTSTDTPDQTQASLTCSDPTPGPNDEMLYCCTN